MVDWVLSPKQLLSLLSYTEVTAFPGRGKGLRPHWTLRVHSQLGKKAGDPLHHVPTARSDANRGTQSVEYPTVKRRTVFVPLESFGRRVASFVMSVGLAEPHEPRPARPGGTAPLTGLYALERTFGVVTGRQPSNAPRESVLAG